MLFIDARTVFSSQQTRFQSQQSLIVRSNKLTRKNSIKICKICAHSSHNSTGSNSRNYNSSRINVDSQSTQIYNNPAQNISRWLTRYLGLSRSEVNKLQATNDPLFKKEFISQQHKVDLLRDQLSISRSQVGRMLVKFPKLLGLSDVNLEKKLSYWIEQVGCKPTTIINNPAVLSRSISSCKETVQFLKMLGVNHPVKLIRKFPLVASLKREGLKVKIDQYAKLLNLDHDKACEMVEEQPSLLGLKDSTVVQKFKGLKTVLQIKDDSVIQIAIWKAPQLLCMSTATIKQSAQWFRQKGITEANFARIVRYSPQVLLLSEERRQENWQSVLNMGVREELVQKVFSMQGVYFGINWTGDTQQLKAHFADQYLGLSIEEVLKTCPMYFTCSLMYRIAPRVVYMKRFGAKYSNLAKLLVPSNQIFDKKNPQFKQFQREFLKNEWPQMLQELQIKLQNQSKQ